MKENEPLTKKNKYRHYWFVLRQLASRELKHGNASKTLGQLWNILNPIISMITMTIIFSAAFHRDIKEFMPYVFTGTLIYGFYNHSLNGSLKALSGNKSLLIRTKIPRNLLVLEKVYVAFIQMLFSLVAYVTILIFTMTGITPHVALVPIMIALSTIIMIGSGKILAVLHVYFPDIKYFFNIFMRFVFFGSAIFYQADKLSPAMQQVVLYNPVYLSIHIARSCILYHSLPDLEIWIRLSVFAVVLYVVGSLIFKKGSQDVVAKL